MLYRNEQILLSQLYWQVKCKKYVMSKLHSKIYGDWIVFHGKFLWLQFKKGWKWNNSKSYWIKEQIEPLCIHPSKCSNLILPVVLMNNDACPIFHKHMFQRCLPVCFVAGVFMSSNLSHWKRSRHSWKFYSLGNKSYLMLLELSIYFDQTKELMTVSATFLLPCAAFGKSLASSFLSPLLS